jgi:hypothetical protein
MAGLDSCRCCIAHWVDQKSCKASEYATDFQGRQFGDNLHAYRHSGKSGSEG